MILSIQCQEFDREVLDLVNKNNFIPMNIYAIVKTLMKGYLSGNGIRENVYQYVLKVWNKFERKRMICT